MGLAALLFALFAVIGGLVGFAAYTARRVEIAVPPQGRFLDIDGERHATVAEKRPELWLARVEADGDGIVTDDVLTREEMCDEFLLMGLRLREGIDVVRFERIAGRKLDPRRVSALTASGLVERTPDRRLRVTAAGFPVLDAVVADLAA